MRVLKKPVQQGRSKRETDAYSTPYVEALSAARTMLEGVCSILNLFMGPLLLTLVRLPDRLLFFRLYLLFVAGRHSG